MNQMIYNVYCDESCHLPLPNDGLISSGVDGDAQVMAIGGIWCPAARVRPLVEGLRALKVRHGLERLFELKWQKVSPAQSALYLEWLDYFFDCDDLHFRGAVVPDKAAFFQYHQRASLGGDHNDAYYRLYFDTLKVIFDPCARYNIYLDAKDTRGRSKLAGLRHKLLDNPFYEVPPDLIDKLQEIRSHESDLLQLADLLLGALTYANRGLENRPDANAGKTAFLARLRERSGYGLKRSTLHGESKLNLWVWHSSHHPDDKSPEGASQEELR